MGKAVKTAIWSMSLLAIVAGMACSGGPGSPVAPSSTGTTIKGTTLVAGASSQPGRRLAAEAPGTVRVCISGTATCAEVGANGTFELSGDFSGDVTLQFTDSQGNTVTLTIEDVRPGETVTVTVELNGASGTIRIESRESGDPDDDDSKDDDSTDDDSEDDDSEDDEDDDSKDDDSKDDDSKDDDGQPGNNGSSGRSRRS